VLAQGLLDRLYDLACFGIGYLLGVPVGVAINPSEELVPPLGQMEELVTGLDLREPAASCVARRSRPSRER
jgi:hypothetical protein